MVVETAVQVDRDAKRANTVRLTAKRDRKWIDNRLPQPATYVKGLARLRDIAARVFRISLLVKNKQQGFPTIYG
jgi:hypothetical protein